MHRFFHAMAAFDHWLILYLERFCQCLQRNTGITNFHLARLTAFGILASLLWHIDLSTWKDPWWIKALVLFVAVLVSVQGIVLIELIYLPLVYRHMHKGCKNPMQAKGSMIGFRNGYVIGLAFQYWIPSILPTALYLYLVACTPLPPGESRLKKWLKRSFRLRFLRPAESQT